MKLPRLIGFKLEIPKLIKFEGQVPLAFSDKFFLKILEISQWVTDQRDELRPKSPTILVRVFMGHLSSYDLTALLIAGRMLTQRVNGLRKDAFPYFVDIVLNRILAQSSDLGGGSA